MMPEASAPLWPDILIALTLLVSFSMRPWRLCLGTHLLAQSRSHWVLGTLVILPGLWALPQLIHMPIALNWSGACWLVLALGWPLAIPVLALCAVLAGLWSNEGWEWMRHTLLWQGTLPAGLALAWGWVVRRWISHHIFVYIIVRAFLGTVLVLFVTRLLLHGFDEQALIHITKGLHLPTNHTSPTLAFGQDDQLRVIVAWLLAWSEAFITRTLTAVSVAFRPHWLATWSDKLYGIDASSQMGPPR